MHCFNQNISNRSSDRKSQVKELFWLLQTFLFGSLFYVNKLAKIPNISLLPFCIPYRTYKDWKGREGGVKKKKIYILEAMRFLRAVLYRSSNAFEMCVYIQRHCSASPPPPPPTFEQIPMWKKFLTRMRERGGVGMV